MKRTLLSLLFCLGWFDNSLHAAPDSNTKPNIVFFLVDDMGWQETSVPFHSEVTALNRRYRTPNMERLAAQGMKFTQAYASAVCSPTRVSALTGMNVARHRVTNWTLRKDRSPDNAHKTLQPPDWNLNGICTNAGIARTMQVTPLPALLRAAGYRTIHVGKAHFGAKETPGENPLNLGFDVNIAGHAAGGPGSYWGEKNFSAEWRSKGERIWDVPGLEAYHGKNIYLTEALTLEAIKAVEKSVADKQPFYLYLSHYAIHAPWEKDERFHQKYLDAGLKPFEATLASMIEGMDKSLGDVMAALARLGVADNTIILFMSDNGAPSQCPRNLPLRGHKLTPYEGGIREPMIVKWPGVTKPASVCREPLVIEDFFPTILELAGADWRGKTVQTVDGVSFVPLLKGEGKTDADRAFVWHFPNNYSGQTPFSALRQGPWKLIYHHADRRLELFNIDEDIGEMRDLAKENPAKVTALAKLLSERLRAEQAQMPVDKATGQPVPLPDAPSTAKSPNTANGQRFRVLSFNILEGGNSSAAGVGFYEKDFGGSRREVVAKVMRDSGADVVCVQEDDASGTLLAILGTNWQRAGTIYSKFPLTPVTTNAYFSLARAHLSATQSVMVANTHWWPKADGTEIIRKHLLTGTLPADLTALEREVLKASDSTSGPRGYQRTIDAVEPLLKAGESVILAGDFNEPSHLDWTQRAADKGMDRLVKNPTSTPLRFKIEWRGSKLLEQLGLSDAYRVVFPDEVAKPGNTWTPPYPNGTPGRRPWDDQVLTRIDRVYFGGPGLKVVEAAVIGEAAPTSEIVFNGRWPSDHRAVLATLGIGETTLQPVPPAALPRKIRVACVGDSTTQGAGVEDRAKDSYPAQLQTLLGDGYWVENFGVGSCTLIRKGRPNVWTTLDRLRRQNPQPNVVVVNLGINDTCGGSRKCWDHKDDFPADCRALVDELRALPSKPRIWLCAPTPMVMETPGIESPRRKDLDERAPRLRELIGVIKAIAQEKQTGFIDLNTPLAGKPELFKEKDGVHLNKEGYRTMAGLVHQALRTGAGLGAETPSGFPGQVAVQPAASTASKPAAAKVPESSLAKVLVWQGIAIEETNHTIWGASPVVAGGKVHLFAARWPEANVDPAWRKSSEIAHYVADKPEGPFRFQEVVLKGTGRTGEWDAFAPHNPEVQRFGDSFALCYAANSDFHQPPHPLNQQVGMVISDSVNGPWKKVGKDGLILGPSPDPKHFSHGKQVVNPALLKVGDKFHLYFKTGGQVRGTTVYGLAIADQLTGPYPMLDEPLTSKGVTIEDGSAFQWDGKVCLLTTDNHGKVTGLRGGGALWVSDDGIHFKPEWTQLGFDLIPRYFAGYDPARVKKVYGGDPKFERPKVLCVEGRPAWLYAPSGWNVTGGQRTVSHVLKIHLQPGDGPLSGLRPSQESPPGTP